VILFLINSGLIEFLGCGFAKKIFQKALEPMAAMVNDIQLELLVQLLNLWNLFVVLFSLFPKSAIFSLSSMKSCFI